MKNNNLRLVTKENKKKELPLIIQFSPAIFVISVIILLIGIGLYNTSRVKYSVAGLGVERNKIFPKENYEVWGINYKSDLAILSPDTITKDGFNIDTEHFSPEAVAVHYIYKDEDNQSALYTLGNSQFGTLIKKGQMYGVVSLNNSEMFGGYILTGDTQSFKDTVTVSNIVKLKGVNAVEFLKTIEYEGKKYDIVKIETATAVDYLYLDKKSQRCVQKYSISENVVGRYTYGDYLGEEVPFFENMETYPFYTKDCEDFKTEYEQFVYASILLANGNQTVNLDEYLPSEEEIEDHYENE